MNAAIIDQDLLSAAWWGYAAIAICEIKNRVCNELCPDSTPDYVLYDEQEDRQYQVVEYRVQTTGGFGTLR